MIAYEKGTGKYRDAVLAGTVTSVKKRYTKEGKNKLLFVTIRSKVYDTDLEEYLAEDNDIVFADNPDGEFGAEEWATRAEKKIKKNRQVIIRTSEKIIADENGNEERKFYGRGVYFVGSHLKTKTTERGPASNIIIGYVVPREANPEEDYEASIGVPLNFYDKNANENYTVFASLTCDNLNEVMQKYKYDKGAGEKCKVACFVIGDYTEEKGQDKRISQINGKILLDEEILFGDKIEENK